MTPVQLEESAVRILLDVAPLCTAARHVEVLKYRDSRVFVGRLVGAGPDGSSVIAKWCRLSTGEIERCVYADVLPDLDTTYLHYYGSHSAEDESIWLFLEDAGDEAVSFANPEHHRLTLGWLAGLLDGSVRRPDWASLPERGPGHYLACLQSGRDRIVNGMDNPALGPEDRNVMRELIATLDGLAEQWDQVENEYADLPKAVVHGDFKEKNVRLRLHGDTAAIVAFDWENAGWGIPGIDWWYFDAASCHRQMRRTWPGLTPSQTARLKVLGGIFRCLDSINWDSRSLTKSWARYMTESMTYYRTRLSELLAGFGQRR